MATFTCIKERRDYEVPKELQNADFIKSIQKYLEIRNLINAAADSVMKEKKNMRYIALTHRIPYVILHQKICIMNLMELYNIKKLKYETALNFILSENKLIRLAAVLYGINYQTLLEEIVKFCNSGEKTYEFDKSFDPLMRTFTFKEELSLLKSVELWKTESKPFCSCRICFMEKLMLIAYQFAQEKKLKYPLTWDNDKRASVGWLLGFDMAHGTKISKIASRNECFRFPQLRSKP